MMMTAVFPGMMTALNRKGVDGEDIWSECRGLKSWGYGCFMRKVRESGKTCST